MNRAYWLRENEFISGQLEDYFPFFKDGRHVIALVGAGGKTTLMYELASLFCQMEQDTAVTTTTHIMPPENETFCRTIKECEERWKARKFAVWAKELESGKLGALEPDCFEQLCAKADQILIEADGAKRMPCKVPASHEPVIPTQADIVIGVVGLDVLGKTVEESCFRLNEAMELLHCDRKHRITIDDLVTILQSERGTRKMVEKRDYYVVLNKCDDLERQLQGAEILRRLTFPAVMTQLLF